MNAFNVTVLFLYACGMSLGQVLFKLSANRNSGGGAEQFLSAILRDGYFLSAVALYAGLTVLWVWILTRVPLSRAYPFVVVSFAVTPALAALIFKEALGSWYVIGLALVLAGLSVLVWKSA
jgi:drug/metabolite transporter (DMT)-like permease